ncbi:MAG: SH3 domain-containing protein [Aggregatilineales bacterium]
MVRVRRYVFIAWIAWLGAALVFAGVHIPANAQAANQVIVGSPVLTLHTAPSTTAPAVKVMQNGDVLTVDGRDSTTTWLHGTTTDNQTGWAYAAYFFIPRGVFIYSLPVLSGGGNSNPGATAAPGNSGGSAQLPSGTIVAAIVGSSALRLRTGPSTTASIVKLMQYGDTLGVDGRDTTANWLHGTTTDNQTGWASASYLVVPTGFSIESLPVLNGNPGGGGNNATPPASSTNLPPPVPRGSVGSGFGLGGQVQSLNGGTVNAMRSAGMTWVKFQVQDGDGGANGLIDQAHGLGLNVLLSVVGDKNSVTNDGYQNGYAGYVAGLAAHGADAIEVWNEMNLDREWPTGQISPASYLRLLSRAYNAIKSANSQTMVITGALAPTGAEGAFGTDRVWNDDRYYAGMAAAGAAYYADCIGAHYNEGIVSPYWSSGDPRGNYPTRYFSSMFYRAESPFGMPICFTELGYLTPEGYGPLPGNFAWAQNTTVADQASWLAGAASRAASYGVRLMIVFNVDFTYYGADPQAGYAMIRPGGACPACAALGAVMR